MNENQETKLLSPAEIATIVLQNRRVESQTTRATIEGLAFALGTSLSNKILNECQADVASAKRAQNGEEK